MFLKSNDVIFKITNFVLIIIACLSLGIGIGLNYYYNKFDYDCSLYLTSYSLDDDYKNIEHEYREMCQLQSEEHQTASQKGMFIAYGITITSICTTILINMINTVQKNKLSNNMK